MRRARIARSFAAVLLGAAGWLAVAQGPAFVAQRRLGDVAWIDSASPEQLRTTAHKALRLWVGDPHDAFLILRQYGDASSIPLLRTALERAPQEGAVSCTWVHGRDALKRLESRYGSSKAPQ